ncbi:HPr family phosphocarrier protein [Trichlorobacter lovleyi]|uniref:HPr family phosphocarrier protein n=1 Tax=Trichlorobacter lovleyi TaxID=313985 RepID=UPI00223FA0B5|nr:HPr family phosphocarrier protein [Trichlorobacter lovleyi]QOX79214.1 HPr family phosphocarrier protein [Trichlorobacter lovleyi]
MQQQEFEIVNKLGLHARASALFVKTASKFQSEVKLARESVEVNGKSIMGIMMLAASKGTKIRLTVEGPDEAEAMETIGALIIDGFGEE